MAEDIGNPDYWKRRLHKAQRRGELHQAIFHCPLDRWQRIEARHKEILAQHILFADRVLDCGCGYGRLLGLLSATFNGHYAGVDLSPDLIAEARRVYHNREFWVCDLGDMPMLPIGFCDWAVLISIRPMIIRNQGQVKWDKMEKEIRRVAKKLLYLEYDENDRGSVE